VDRGPDLESVKRRSVDLQPERVGRFVLAYRPMISDSVLVRLGHGTLICRTWFEDVPRIADPSGVGPGSADVGFGHLLFVVGAYLFLRRKGHPWCDRTFGLREKAGSAGE
jgi:hypothetical protein